MTTPPHPTLPRLTLILGGARSGKSRFAEERISVFPGAKTYIATAEAWDGEMSERIAVHQSRRSADWVTLNAPLDLSGALKDANQAGRPILIDCLTLWLTNVMLAERDIAAETAALLASLSSVTVPTLVVSNEVGLGIVPSTPLGRRFRDAQGSLNQAVAKVASEVLFIAAGLPLTLKARSSTPNP